MPGGEFGVLKVRVMRREEIRRVHARVRQGFVVAAEVVDAAEALAVRLRLR